MIEWPIIFSGDMVRAIIEGRKTQTRRMAFHPNGHPTMWTKRLNRWAEGINPALWVLETWWQNDSIEGVDGVAYRADGEFPEHMSGTKWRPAIHMPRWASRLVLPVVGMRLEGLQDIIEDDAEAEGADALFYMDAASFIRGRSIPESTHRNGFRHVWNEIHGPGAWDANPEVVVIEWRKER